MHRFAPARIATSYALDAETATHVGGDLTDLGKKLAVLEEASARVAGAAPHAFQDLQAALHRLATAQGQEALAQNVSRGVLSLGFIALLMYAMRALTVARRGRWVTDSIAARGCARSGDLLRENITFLPECRSPPVLLW